MKGKEWCLGPENGKTQQREEMLGDWKGLNM